MARLLLIGTRNIGPMIDGLLIRHCFGHGCNGRYSSCAKRAAAYISGQPCKRESEAGFISATGAVLLWRDS